MTKTILVPIEDTTRSDKTVQQAGVVASAFSAGVHLLGLIQSASQESVHQFTDPVSWDVARKQKQVALAELVARLESEGITAGLEVLDTFTIEAFIRYVKERDFDLIVLSEEYQPDRALIRNILAHTSVPVFVIRSPLTSQIQRILVPLDGSQRAECILPSATTLAQAMGATLLLTHVVKEPDMPRRTSQTAEDMRLVKQLVKRNQQEGENYLNDLAERLPVTTETHMVVHSNITMALHDQIKTHNVDLVGLCAHGFSGKPDWPFGSITSNLIDYCPTSLIILQDLPFDLPAIEAEASGRTLEAVKHASYRF